MKNLSDNLKKIRKENNLSQEQLAEKLGVSRQSVSKWESNQAYPEMDKMIKLSQLFNLNMDDLLNQDIKEVNSNKQSKLNINKYVDDFLDFITKTIDMFSSMKLKAKVKCLFEQVVLIGIILLVFLVCGGILENIYSSVFSLFPDYVYYAVYNILRALYILQCLILGTILILHIFKVRYLDYYIIVKEDKIEDTKEVKDENEVNIEKEKNKIVLEKPKEKIIIRDSKHSGYNIISGLLKSLLFIIKLVALLITGVFCLSLVIFVILFVISFIFVKTGLLFIGTIILLLSMITMNILILILLYNFILSRKSKKNKIAISFIISIILMGVGIGLFSIGITKLDIIDLDNSNHFIKEEVTIEMRNDLFIEDYMNNITYIESDNKDIRIEYIYHTNFYVKLNEKSTGEIFISHYVKEYNIDELLKSVIKDLNNNQIVNYSGFEVKIYTTKENIVKLKENLENYWNDLNELERQEQINQYEQTINDLETQIIEKDNRIDNLQEELFDKENQISILEDNCNME